MPDPRADPRADPYGGLHVETTSTTQRVADELRRAVFDGELEAGTPLREVPLAAALGVARSTVREALGVLVAESIATREPHRGVSVAVPDVDGVRDVCRARTVLETAGVRRWADASEAERQEVRDRLAAYTGAVARGAGYAELNETHLEFHVALVGLAGSPRLVHTARALVAELKVVLAQIDRAERNAHDQADSHDAIVALLEQGRVDDGVTAIIEHLRDAERDILQALGAS